mgnify:CR=1 FL=1
MPLPWRKADSQTAGLAQTERLEEVRKLAFTDPLTGLANRRLLPERVWMAIAHARRNKSAMAVLYLDLDGFKEVNDSLGHTAGDHLLRQIGPRLEPALRPGEVLARLGGDEFAVLLGGPLDQPVVVGLGAAGPHHAVDGRRSPQQLAARPLLYLPARTDRLGLVVVGVAIALEREVDWCSPSYLKTGTTPRFLAEGHPPPLGWHS